MTKVVYINCWKNNEPRHAGPVQLELFANETKVTGIVGYFDISAHSQDTLLSTLTKKSIRVIFDIRSSKALPRMKYNHAEVFDYLSKTRIMYNDAENFILEYRQISESKFYQEKESLFIEHRMRDLLNHGPCLVIYDSNVNHESLRDFRVIFRSMMNVV